MGALLLVPVAVVAGCARPSPPPPAPPPAPTAVPSPTAVPTPPPSAEPPAANRYPGEVLDLSNWYLTLPTGRKSAPDDVYQPALTTYVGPYFHLNRSGDGVVFTANAGGATTSGSNYPRSELREMSGDHKADWSNRTGTHTLSVRQAVMRLPQVKPDVVTAQIHDAEDDVLEVRLEGERLIAEYQDGDGEVVIDPVYRLGTPYDLRIEAAGSRVRVFYNGELKADIPESGSGWYFKAGSYVQSNLDRGDDADAVGEVVIYSLQAAHAR
jgi:alginate lyase